MEHGRHADVTAEVTGIAAEPRQRGGGGVKQQTVDQARMALRERVEGMREREDDMEVRNRQNLAAAGGKPALSGHALALRTVAVAAGVVGDALGAARGADGPMAAQYSGAALGDGVQAAVLGGGQAMGAPMVRGVGAHDVGQFEAGRPRGGGARPDGRGRRHASGAGGFGQIQRGAGRRDAALGEVPIARGGGEVTMPEQMLDGV